MYIIPAKIINEFNSGTRLYSKNGVGLGNHNPNTKCHIFDLIVRDRAKIKSSFVDKNSLMEELLIPSAAQAGFKNPKTQANTFYGWGVKEGWIIST